MFSLFKKKKILATHNGTFHTDDVFATATLLLTKEFKHSRVIRTRDESILKKADCVFDVGRMYNPSENRFDHHQFGGAGARENGIPYAAFGLVWKEFGAHVAGSQSSADTIDRLIVQAIDASDNGFDIYTPKYENVSLFTIQDIIASFKPLESTRDRAYDRGFMKAVAFAKRHLLYTIASVSKQERISYAMKTAYEHASDKRLLVVDVAYDRFNLVNGAVDLPEVLLIAYPSVSRKNEWNLVCTRDVLSESRTKILLPEAWRGLDSTKLQQVTGVPDVIFCHNSGFLAAARSKEGILKLAEIALQN